MRTFEQKKSCELYKHTESSSILTLNYLLHYFSRRNASNLFKDQLRESFSLRKLSCKGVTDKIGRILKRASINTYFKPPKKINQFL
ncbi:hypothetical protein evm_003596 [Chilo suppressalis]|nr:hypothetical protein evm_003596 [Chilo suppressalis]